MEALAVLPKANRVDAQVGSTLFCHFYMCGSRVGGRGGGDCGFGTPFKNHKNIGFLSNTGQDPLKNQARFQCWAIISIIVLRLRADDGPLLV